jgi:hypothetical protein
MRRCYMAEMVDTWAIKKASEEALISKASESLDALAVFASACINFNFVALCHEQRHSYFKTCCEFGGLQHFA